MAKIILQGEEEKRKNIYYEVDTLNPVIGEGGMGKVMRGVCVDKANNNTKPVAIKFLYGNLPPHAIERARREASIQLRNDNLVEMLGFIETETASGNKHYHVVSELLHGISLSSLLEGKCSDSDGKEIPFACKMLQEYRADAVRFAKVIVMNVLSGLVALHDAGYIHRDIDPTNIMLTDDGHIKLIDFGIAKKENKLTTNDRGLTSSGVFMGKAEYAAPELVLGDLKHQNQTTDIYAMGILLFQCIVGHVPFEGPSNIVLDNQLHKKLPLSLIKDKGIRNVIACATDKDQKVRYQSASQMRVAMEGLDGIQRQMKKSTKRTIVLFLFVIIVGLLGVAVFVYNDRNTRIEKERIAEKFRNDSLSNNAIQFIRMADANFNIGDKHGEGYEKYYVSALKEYRSALASMRKMTITTPEFPKIEKKEKSVVQALNKAKAEFQAKASEFESEAMGDIALEFHKRIDIINKAIKE